MFKQILSFDKNDREVIDLSSSDDELVSIESNENDYINDDYIEVITNDSLNAIDFEGRVLVNVGHPPEDPDIYLAPQIDRKIKRHQIEGIRFLYDNVIESLEKVKKSSGFGCILSHEMGLGKTMQIISFVDIFLSHTNAKHVLCIVPINTLKNWISELKIWVPEKERIERLFRNSELNEDVKYRAFEVFDVNEDKSIIKRAKTILKWRKSGGLLLLGYEMFRILTTFNNRNSCENENIGPEIMDRINTKVRAALIDPGPELIICDEGHRIKNFKADISRALKNVRTKRRIVLTGYPLQNNLMEYWCMIDFVRPKYLGSKDRFTDMFERPITRGQYIDSTKDEKQIMKFRAFVLNQLLKGFVQRRTHSVFKNVLPLKCEYVLMCRMTPIQKDLMIAFLDTVIKNSEAIGIEKRRISTFTLFAICFKIQNNPDIVFDDIRKNFASDDFDLDFSSENGISENNRIKNEAINDFRSMIDETTDSFNDNPIDLFDIPLRQRNGCVLDWSWAQRILLDYIPGLIDNSFKMVLLFDIITECLAIGDRLLIFSHSLLTLDLIERYLQSKDIPKTRTKWAKNVSYYRMDGSTSTDERHRNINLFNSTNSAYLFLISTRAGSLGINLIGANRIVVFDNSWNPCHEAQAMCRIYRYGQTKPCYIYRFVCDNSLEKKIYDRQVNKQGIFNRVVDEQNPKSLFTWREIHDLMSDLHNFEEPPVEYYTDEQLSKLDDSLIKTICSKDNHCITRLPFESQSLLLDQMEEKLSSAEKQMAFNEYKECLRLYNLRMDYLSIKRNALMSQNWENSMPRSSNSMPSEMTRTFQYSNPDSSQPLSQGRGISPHLVDIEAKRRRKRFAKIRTHSRPSSTESHPPEVIELSDDEESNQTFNISSSSELLIVNEVDNGLNSSITKRKPNKRINSTVISIQTNPKRRRVTDIKTSLTRLWPTSVSICQKWIQSISKLWKSNEKIDYL